MESYCHAQGDLQDEELSTNTHTSYLGEKNAAAIQSYMVTQGGLEKDKEL